MKESLQKAHLVMMDGDRDSVLEQIDSEANTTEVLWLRAQSALNEETRLSLLEQVAAEDHPVYSPLAAEIVRREREFAQKLSATPDYQFWKKPGWRAKMAALRQQRVWSLSLLAVALISILVLISSAFQSQAAAAAVELTAQAAPRPTATITAIPPAKRASLSYPAGDFTAIRIENPTNRLVITAGGMNAGTPAAPAVGAHYLALQFEFICRIALCENPPEAQVSLKLDDGNIVSYSSNYQPVLAEIPGPARISKDQMVSGWLVFEIPNQAQPAALLFPNGTSYDAPPLELPLPR